ncbi:MAG: ABC transporter permease [Clostridium sp.]|nr:ABC transporter permease [Clostridium sp.]
MYFKLALKNVKKSFKDYAVYFFTLIVGVSIFYMFNSIESQTLMLELTNTKHEMLETMAQVLSIISVFVAFILAFLIIYASGFLMKRRKKEFGIYMLLGMKKRKISRIILAETLLVGIISLIVGLVVGIGLSQLMSVVVANMFEANMTNFAFTFSSSALLKTCIYFAIIYLVIMIFNVISVNRCKLIDLINSKKKSEQVKLKNMTLCVIIFLMAVAMLGYAYYNVTINRDNLVKQEQVLMQIILGIVSTFLIFWSLSGMLLKIVMTMKKTYYKGINAFVTKQLSSKINTTVISTTIICLMLFVTICIFSTAMSLNDAMNDKIAELPNVDIEINKNKDGNGCSIKEEFKQNNIDTEKYFKEIHSLYIYSTNQVTQKDALGETIEEVLEENPSMKLALNEEEQMIKISEYNEIAKLLGKETFELENDQYIVISDQEYMSRIRSRALKTNPILNINGKQYAPKYEEIKNISLEIDSDMKNTGIIVIPDNAVSEDMKAINKVFANYNTDDKKEKLRIEDEVKKKLQNFGHTYSITRQELADSSIGFGAMVVFLGLYLGIVFLISSGAIIALKELSESNDNKERYDVLRKIGCSEKVINRALFKQIGLFFLFPLLLAVIHSIPGISVASYMIENMGKGNMLNSIILTAGFIILIYGGYFLISYFSSKRIIREK